MAKPIGTRLHSFQLSCTDSLHVTLYKRTETRQSKRRFSVWEGRLKLKNKAWDLHNSLIKRKAVVHWVPWPGSKPLHSHGGGVWPCTDPSPPISQFRSLALNRHRCSFPTCSPSALLKRLLLGDAIKSCCNGNKTTGLQGEKVVVKRAHLTSEAAGFIYCLLSIAGLTKVSFFSRD